LGGGVSKPLATFFNSFPSGDLPLGADFDRCRCVGTEPAIEQLAS
jgi:hypothetical protein